MFKHTCPGCGTRIEASYSMLGGTPNILDVDFEQGDFDTCGSCHYVFSTLEMDKLLACITEIENDKIVKPTSPNYENTDIAFLAGN